MNFNNELADALKATADTLARQRDRLDDLEARIVKADLGDGRGEAPAVKGDASALDRLLAAIVTGYGNEKQAKEYLASEDEQKAWLTYSAAHGGILEPQFTSPLLASIEALSVASAAGVRSVPVNGPTRFPRFASRDSVAWTGEGQDWSETDFTLASVSAYPKKATMQMTVSIEQNEDNPEDLPQRIGSEFALAFAAARDKVVFEGDGVGEPEGLANNADLNETASIGTPTSWGPVLAGFFKVRGRSFAPTAYVQSTTDAEVLAGLADTTGQPLRRPEAIASLPLLDTAALTAGTAYIGDFSTVVIAVRRDVQIQVDPFSKGKSGEIVLRGYMRMDVVATQPNAIQRLAGLTTS
jgi:HK97 family phage major capsid protein